MRTVGWGHCPDLNWKTSAPSVSSVPLENRRAKVQRGGVERIEVLYVGNAGGTRRLGQCPDLYWKTAVPSVPLENQRTTLQSGGTERIDVSYIGNAGGTLSERGTTVEGLLLRTI